MLVENFKNAKIILLTLTLLNQEAPVFTNIVEIQSGQGLIEDYCQYETFKPQCWKNEIIIMKTAVYGRRKIGRCIKEEEVVPALKQDQSYLGCFADVLDIVDKKCSGKSQCEIRIPDADFESTKTCYKKLWMYLEASYSCVTVVDEDRTCTVLVNPSPLHITSSSLSKIGCGTKSQPWTLEAPAGQRINMTLLDFTNGKSVQGQESSTQHMTHNCLQYGYIIDNVKRKNVSICGNRTNRQTAVYLSSSNSLELSFNRKAAENYTFVLKFEATGCSDLIPPEDTWLKRNDDEVIIGCYSSRQTWHLKCKEQKWVGVVSNCTQDRIHKGDQEIIASQNDYEVLTIVAISFIGLAICLTIICSGIICLRRYYALEQKSANDSQKKSLKYKNTNNKTTTRSIIQVDNGPYPQKTQPIMLTNQDNFPMPSQQFSLYAGNDSNKRNDNHNNQAPMMENSQYFLLDQEMVARESESVRMC